MLPVQNTVEFIEYTLQISWRNARTTISHTHDYLLSLEVCTNFDWRLRWRVADSVLYEIRQDLIDLEVVQFDQQQVLRGQVCLHNTPLQEWIEPPQHIMNERS